MSFKELMQQDYDNTFMNADEFAESVEYTSYEADQTFTINAIYDRKPLAPDTVASGLTGELQAELRISQSDIAKVAEGSDTVAVLTEDGEQLNYTVEEIISSKYGEWHLRLQE